MLKMNHLMMPFLLIVTLDSCGGGSNSYGGGGGSGETSREETSCKVMIEHPQANGANIVCFTLSIAQTNQIIQTELQKRNYVVPLNGGDRLLTSNAICPIEDGDPRTNDGRIVLSLEFSDGVQTYEGVGNGTTQSEADTAALKNSLQKIPACP